MAYQWDLLPELIERMERGQVQESHQHLDMVLRIIEEAHQTITLRRHRCVQVMSHCLRGGLRGGAHGDEIYTRHMSALDQIIKLRSWTSIQTFMHNYVQELLEGVRKTQSTDVERAIEWIRKSIELELDKPLNLQQFADKLNLSREHLSRTFTRIVGRSFRDELQQKRMKKGIELLTKTQLKINIIAKQTGYKNSVYFIAAFKKVNNLTPGEYRRLKRNL